MLLTTALITSVCAIAQTTLKLPQEKMIEHQNNSWQKWPATWESTQKKYDFVPNVTIRKVDEDIYSVEFYFGGSSSGIFRENIIFDPTETAKIRKSQSNNSLSAYRYSGSKDYLWTEGVTIAELYKTPSKWTSVANAKMYTWQYSLGSATVYKGQSAAPTSPLEQKYTVNFKSKKQKIKGTWGSWSGWDPVKNSYFELKVITEGRVFNFKYYEHGKMVKNYDITYDDAHTKEARAQNEKTSCYKINGSGDDWVYLMNTSMTNILANSGKWSNENDAVILILDDEKTGFFTRIK